MDDILAGLGLSSDVTTIFTVYGVVVLATLWLATVIWAYRDMRARSRDTFAQLGVAVMVALLLLPGLLIYIFLRPRETLGEAYERSLEEEALLQEIEEKPTCPGCGQRIQESWQACPHCFTRLKKPCIHCRQMLELSWQLCPYCAAPQPGANIEQTSGGLRHVRPASVPEQTVLASATSQNARTASQRKSDQLEFVEGDDF